ncbi:MAG: FIST N-terminal domain-containing protein [Candidatus Nanopelagicales bacterium]
MAARTLIGDGLALGDDLRTAAEHAVASALAPLSGTRPDLAFVFVSGGTPEESADALLHATDLVGARNSVGCTAHGVIAAGRGVEGECSVSVWVASLPSVSVRAFHLEVLRTGDSIAVLGMPDRHGNDVVAVLLADPWSFPVDGFVGHSHDALAGLPIVGGMASGPSQPGQTRLVVDGRVHDRGAVGVVLGGALSVHALVSQGCRPIGRPMTVTRAEGETILELAGLPALTRAKDAVAELPDDEQPLAVRGLQLGLAVDEYADEHRAGDFLVREITAADHVSGSISVGEVVEVGTTVQYLLRDAETADEDLAEVLLGFRSRLGLESLAGALLFSCGSRGRAMFPTPDHDVAAVRHVLGIENVAGFFASGEIGPLGGRNRVHGSTATVLAFGS